MSGRAKSIPRVQLEVGDQLRVPKLQYTDRWHENVKNIPVPYNGKSPHKANLIQLVPKSKVLAMDEAAVNLLSKKVDDVQKLYINRYKAQLNRQPDKLKRAQDLLDRADYYLSQARKLERSWRNGFDALGHGDTYPWPLSIPWAKLHNGHCKIKGYGYKGKNKFDPGCPTKKEHIGHDADAEILERLLLAATKCIAGAREIAELTYVYEINKDEIRAPRKKTKTRSGGGEGPSTSSASSKAKGKLLPIIDAQIGTIGPSLTPITATPMTATGTTGVPDTGYTASIDTGDTSELGEADGLEDELMDEDEILDDAMVDEELGAEDPEELADEEDEDDSKPAKSESKGMGTGIILAGAAVIGGLLLFGKK